MLQSADAMVLKVRMQNFQIDIQKFDKFAAEGVFLILMRLMTIMIESLHLWIQSYFLAKIIQVIRPKSSC